MCKKLMVFSRQGWAGGFVYEEMQVSPEQLGVDGSFRISLQESPLGSVRTDCFHRLELFMHSVFCKQ